MVDFKVTKKTKLLEVKNDMCHNFYYLIQGHIINEQKTKYKKFKYVEWFDIFDLQEYFEKDIISQKNIREYLNCIEIPYIYGIKDYNDTKGLKEFYDFCNKTIKKYNKIVK